MSEQPEKPGMYEEAMYAAGCMIVVLLVLSVPLVLLYAIVQTVSCAWKG